MVKILLLPALGFLVILQGTESHVYVDPVLGNDANSGTKSKPVFTIQVGLDKAAVRIPKVDAVVLKDGRYSIVEPVTFTALHSGIALKAEHSGMATISGGVFIGGWQQETNGQWSANIPLGMDVQQLFMNGERKTRARTPNIGYYNGAGAFDPSKRLDLSYEPNKDRFYFKDGQFDGVLPSEETNVYVTIFHAWTSSFHGVDQLDRVNNLVYLASPMLHPITRWTPDIRFVVENYRAALDAPGEWYFDSAAGEIFYIPEAGELIAQSEFTVPVVTQLMEFAGTGSQPVMNISVEGIVFEYSNWDVPRTNSAGGQLHGLMHSYAVHGDYVRSAKIEGCTFKHVGADALWLEEGCEDVLIRKNHFHDLGGSAVKVGVMSPGGTPVPANELTQRITVDNNLIHDCGIVFHGSCGIGILKSPNNVVSHNAISDLDYTAISIGRGWVDFPSTASNNIVEYNRIGYLGRAVLSDMAGIYVLGPAPGSVVRNNIIHDVDAYQYGAHGIYADAYGRYHLVKDNLVYRTQEAGLMRNQGDSNIASNNIFAFCGGLYQSGLAVPNPPAPGFYIDRNISYCNGRGDSGTDQLFHAHDHPLEMSSNLYWNLPDTNVTFGPYTFVEWQALGKDSGSLVADPLFVNPLMDNFTLQAGSPAFSLGFNSIDYDAPGLYGDSAWTELPNSFRRTISIASSESSYVNAQDPNSAHGTWTLEGWYLWNGSGDLKRVLYYRFELPPHIPLSSITGAALRLATSVLPPFGDRSYSVVALTNETSDVWSENTLTWSNAPAHNLSTIPSQAWNPAANPNPFILTDTALAGPVFTVPLDTLACSLFDTPLNADGIAMIHNDTDGSVTFMVVANDISTGASAFFMNEAESEQCTPKLVLEIQE